MVFLILFHISGGNQPNPSFASIPSVDATKEAFVYRKCTRPGLFSLSYDDGPSTNFAALLDILKEKNVKASFFVNGLNRGNISSSGPLLQRAMNEGHLIGTHTYDHILLKQMDIYGHWQQLQRNDEELLKTIGKKPKYFRPPYGLGAYGNGSDYEQTIRIHVGSWGYTLFWQNIVTLDTENIGNPNAVAIALAQVETALATASPLNDSFIVLAHDFVDSTLEFTSKVIPLVLSKGYQFVTADVCIGETPYR